MITPLHANGVVVLHAIPCVSHHPLGRSFTAFKMRPPPVPIFPRARGPHSSPTYLHRSHFSIDGPEVQMERLDIQRVHNPNLRPRRSDSHRFFALMIVFGVDQSAQECPALTNWKRET
ncbi:hypothetical protein AVEN_105975-1 [Araneus ventricosus]|uniref:Uncharacterized protein n=1 Tax=Araneus ventricosus TaxID=182803 RepID=A0A4Y2DV46_ARAVE|nr:hypothetical protein AVEN_105975-1 [Araneus ventricosus]